MAKGVEMGAVITARRERFEAWVVDEADALDELSQRMGDGEFLAEICREKDVPQSRVMAWLMGDVKRFEVYQRALRVQAAIRVEEALEDAKGGGENVPHAKLVVDTKFRQAAFYDPERFSPKGVADVGAMAEGITEALQRISERKRAAMLEAQRVVDGSPGRPLEREVKGEVVE